ncbi:hypothetical protein [Pedobacter sp. UBA4863]|uniref:hypothetical protein n=1 Tax=Pedobacter sp. UBA4863 TaxID=1947060 RepID=UPI0025FF8880|nr:hypothetical protein [Pedobacter sp. UBA4863]
MKTTVKFLTAFLICCAITSCKKKPEVTPVPIPINKPVAVEHGSGLWGGVTKSIGAAGGTIELAGSGVKIIVPPGAVDAETNFNILPVTNTLNKTSSNKSFRLLPENVSFKKDIEIVMGYDSQTFSGSSEDFLRLAYQDKEGFWHPAKNATLNKANKTLSVKTKHFSDWSIYAEFSVKSSKNRLFAGEEATLEVRVMDPKNYEADDYLISDGELVPNANIEGWKILYGEGTLAGGAAAKQTLKAPATINTPAETVVQVDVKNNQGVKLYVGAVAVWIVPKNYIAWNFGGAFHYSKIPNFYRDNFGGFRVSAMDDTGPGNIYFYINNSFKVGNYEFGNEFGMESTGSSTHETAGRWLHVSICPSGFTYMPGIISIYSTTGYLDGDFEGTLTQTKWDGQPMCNGKTFPIKGSFSIKLP